MCELITSEIKNVKALLYLLDIGNRAFLFELVWKIKIVPEDGEVLLIKMVVIVMNLTWQEHCSWSRLVTNFRITFWACQSCGRGSKQLSLCSASSSVLL